MVVVHPGACIMERGRGKRDNLKVLRFRRQRRMGRVHGGSVELCSELQYEGITRDKASKAEGRAGVQVSPVGCGKECGPFTTYIP